MPIGEDLNKFNATLVPRVEQCMLLLFTVYSLDRCVCGGHP